MAQSRELSKRELEVLEMLSRGHTNRGIAKALCLALTTVSTHLVNIFTKIGLEGPNEEMKPRILAAKWYWENSQGGKA